MDITNPRLETVADVETWFDALLDAGMNFHPDDPLGEIVHRETGERVFTDEQAERVNAAMTQAWGITSLEIYALGLQAFARYDARRLKESLWAELREVAEWFGDEEHGVPLRSDTVYTGKPEDWKGYTDNDGQPHFQISERSYMALCEALAHLDELEEINERSQGAGYQ